MSSLADNPLIKSILTRYDKLEEREQRMVVALVVFLIGVGIYTLIWQPVRGYYLNSERTFVDQTVLYEWIKVNEAKAQIAKRTRDRAQGNSRSGQSLLTLIPASARQNQINITRIQPEGSNALNVTLENVPFNNLMRWLDRLQKQNKIQVQQISIDRQEQPGLANVRLVLRS